MFKALWLIASPCKACTFWLCCSAQLNQLVFFFIPKILLSRHHKFILWRNFQYMIREWINFTESFWVHSNKLTIYRKFEEIYDVDQFVKSLDGVVKVVKGLPDDVSIRDFAVVKVPNRVSDDHIAEQIKPVFKTNSNIRLATFFPSVNMRKTTKISASDSVACLAMFGTLQLQPEVNEVVDSMIERLRTLSRKSNGQFIAVDLRVEILEKKGCHGSSSAGTKSCFSAQEIAIFLRKMGFDKDTTIYLTQPRWDESLDVLKDIFPKTYTKVRHFPLVSPFYCFPVS